MADAELLITGKWQISRRRVVSGEEVVSKGKAEKKSGEEGKEGKRIDDRQA